MYIEDTENVRKWALGYGLTFADTYQDAPFHDPNWQLVRGKLFYGHTKRTEGFI